MPCHYFTRPAPSDKRARRNAAGQVVLKLMNQWRKSTTDLVMTSMELMERLVALLKRARANVPAAL